MNKSRHIFQPSRQGKRSLHVLSDPVVYQGRDLEIILFDHHQVRVAVDAMVA